MLSKAARSYATTASSVKTSVSKGSINPALSSLKVVVHDAGSKNGPTGIAHLLSRFNFLNTESKSALRLKRESELLGAAYTSSVTRDNLVLQSTFLKEDLPYFVNSIGSVLTETSFKPHELSETVLSSALYDNAVQNSCPGFRALESLHAISFKRGLGKPLYYDGFKQYSADEIKQYAQSVYTADNVEVVATGVVESDLKSFLADSPFANLKNGSISAVKSPFFKGNESRLRSAGRSAAAIGVPIQTSDIGSYSLLAASVASQVPSALSTEVIANVASYKDAGLFYVIVKSSNAQEVAETIKKVSSVVKNSAELEKYTAFAKLQLAKKGLDVKVEGAKAVGLPKLNYVVVGDVDALPFADEL